MKLNELNLVLPPTLRPVFSKEANKSALSANDDSRDLFYGLIHVSEHYDALPRAYYFLKKQLHRVNQDYHNNFSKKFSPASLAALQKQAATPDNRYPLEDNGINNLLVQNAPIYFTELGWLVNITQTVTSQSPLVVDLMGIYLRLTADDNSIARRREIYQAHLNSSGILMPPIHTVAFAKQADLCDEMFDFAATQLALAQFPRVFFPEILGFTLAYCLSSSLPELFFPAPDDTKLPNFLAARRNINKLEATNIAAVIKNYLNAFSAETEALWQRIQAGFWLHQQQLDRCQHAIVTQAHTVLSPRQSVEKLLNQLIPNAIGHHGNIRLGGKTIDEWFKEKPFKSANFLATLLHTPYIDRTKPENSKLLKLFEFEGPMFGVLDDEGKAIVKNWLLAELNSGLASNKKTSASHYKVGLKSIAKNTATAHDSIPVEEMQDNISQTNYSRLSNRELYHYLVNIDLYPEVLPTAKSKVNFVLNLAKYFNRPPFSQYSHKAFESFVNTIYQREVNSYKPLTGKPKLSKEAYLWGIEQFAPTILTDGSWLQGIQQLDYFPNHDISALLFRIYEDETGNGILNQNHPHIYDDLLTSLDIQLPPIQDKAFIQHQGFIDSAFDIPVYLMAISKFPNTFLPELLGLNLAIEISGLGKVYLNLSEELKFWGISSKIVDVHTSIDNLATGHTALAIKAIEAHLDDISANFGENVMYSHWRRIYTGYCSLQTASKRFKFSLIGQYLMKRSQLENPNTANK